MIKTISRVLFFLVLLPGMALGQDRVVQSVVVYNKDIALIHELRTLEVPRGVVELGLDQVAAGLIPESVWMQFKDGGKEIRILEQNFQTGHLTGQALLETFRGKQISLITKSSGLLEGSLLSASHNELILQKKDQTVSLIYKPEILSVQFPSLPDRFESEAKLTVKVDNRGSSKRTAELFYLTRGLKWEAVYSAVLDTDEKSLQLSGDVALTNQSGLAFTNVTFHVVAGDINLALRSPVQPITALRESGAAQKVSQTWQQQAVSDYYLFTLNRPVTIGNGQKKQIELFAPARLKIQKEYVYEGQRNPSRVRVDLVFRNTLDAGLGRPLPAGRIMMYRTLKSGERLFVGQDAMSHTPKGEKVRLTMGLAFDLRGERKKLFDKRIDGRTREERYQIRLRNHKDRNVEIRVIERYRGEWEIISTNIPVTLRTAEQAEWLVDVPRNQERMLVFTVRRRW